MFDIIFKEVKKLSLTLLIIDVIISAVTLIGGLFSLPVLFGMIYGFVFSNLMFILLGTIVARSLDMTENSARRHMKTNFIARYALTALIIAIPFFVDYLNPWCVIVSMLAPKLTYFSIGFFDFIRTIINERRK